MWKITENLYLAQLPMIDGPTRVEAFRKNKIKRVLTVTTEAVEHKVDGVDYKFLFMYDMPSQALLENGILEEAVSYVDNAVENDENVVVHCLAAVSRSVTVCVAYLMFKNRWSLEKALKIIQSIRKCALPNPGFLAQLKIWEKNEMDFSVEKYRNIKIEVPGGEEFESKTLWLQQIVDNRAKVRFKCRSCRKLLFVADNLSHRGGESCQKYLVEPMTWLRVTGASCSLNHSCGAKIGSFVGNGERCNGCTKFVKPWIFIDKSKIDKVEPTI